MGNVSSPFPQIVNKKGTCKIMALASKLQLVKMINVICEANDKLNVRIDEVHSIKYDNTMEGIVNRIKSNVTNSIYCAKF